MSHRIEIPETDQAFEAEDGESILAAALRANIALAHDCQLGGCGTCRVKLIEGNVVYNETPFALTPAEESEGFALACQAMPTSDLCIAAARHGPPCSDPARFTAVVRKLHSASSSVFQVTLQIPDAKSIAWLPGQYLNILMDDGSTRSFSMAATPQQNLFELHVRRIAGGSFTDHRLAQLRPGDMIEVEFPLGSFRLHREDYRPVLMVATGTGLAPFKAMLESLMDDPDCPPVRLYWGMQTTADLYLHNEIQTWSERLCEFRYVPVLSRADACWQGRRGYVQDAVAGDFEDLSEHSIYLCGSPRMIFDAKQAFLARGASAENLYTEGFAFQRSLSVPA